MDTADGQVIGKKQLSYHGFVSKWSANIKACVTTQSRPSQVGLKESGTTSFGVFTFVRKFKADMIIIAMITAKSDKKLRVFPERYPELLKFFNVILMKNAPANSIMDIKKIFASKSQSS